MESPVKCSIRKAWPMIAEPEIKLLISEGFFMVEQETFGHLRLFKVDLILLSWKRVNVGQTSVDRS